MVSLHARLDCAVCRIPCPLPLHRAAVVRAVSPSPARRGFLSGVPRRLQSRLLTAHKFLADPGLVDRSSDPVLANAPSCHCPELVDPPASSMPGLSLGALVRHGSLVPMGCRTTRGQETERQTKTNEPP
jgi:hypothetical protein